MEDVAARGKRSFLARWWIGQALVAYFGLPLFLIVFADGKPADGDLTNVWFDGEYAAWILGIVGFLSLMQGLFLLPVRAPTGRGPRAGLLWSATAGGFVVATTLAAALFAVVEALMDFGGISKDGGGGWFSGVLVVFGLSWIVATPLCVKFVSRAATPEDGLARLATRHFAGTLVEVVSAMPLDLLARRKNDCTCGRGTFWAVLLGLAAGAVVLGPVVFLVLLARRRVRWPGGRCVACGADVGDALIVRRCPSCGAGWAA